MNYSELRAASIAYADRYDTEVSNNIDTFIIMVEARINRLLKTRRQTARAYVNTVDDKEFYALPPDWRGMRDIQIDDPNAVTGGYNTYPLVLTDPKSFETHKREKHGGNYYCVIDNQIQIYPILAAGCSIQMVYYQQVPNLNSLDDTNWLSIDHPDIYLAGMTGEISLFAKDYDAATGWFDRLKTSVDELDNVDWKERWSGDPLVVRTA